MELSLNHLYMFLASLVAGYLGFQLLFAVVRLRLKSDGSNQHGEILKDAKIQAENLKKTERMRLEDDLAARREELEEAIRQRQEDFKLESADLDNRHSSLQREESRLEKASADMEQRKERVQAKKEEYEVIRTAVDEQREEFIKKLGERSGSDPSSVKKSIVETAVDDRQIQAQKTLRILDEELESSSKRIAVRTMIRAMSRYAPEFYWPKSINFVEVGSRSLVEKLSEPEQRILTDMKELAEIEVELLADNENQQPIVRLAGGAGVDREAVRLALTDLFAKGAGAWHKSEQTFRQYREQLENEAIQLGRKAVIEVGLDEIHPEIQKLVGYLNWRTSYRQNQWYHTVEVAKLAGLIANELGIDPDAAKRCGLLHDIGKAIDYRIEGSHAVISGDYADRFGETRLICDTVMSHHNDLIVETPLSFVLKTADTLSGARPGARVNLEEGYQMRLSGIDHAIRSFPGVVNVAIMNGAREVHVEVNHKRVREEELTKLTQDMAHKVSHDVAFPGEIKILVSRRFEATSVA